MNDKRDKHLMLLFKPFSTADELTHIIFALISVRHTHHRFVVDALELRLALDVYPSNPFPIAHHTLTVRIYVCDVC